MGVIIYFLFGIVLNGVNGLGRLKEGNTVDFRSAFDEDLYQNVLDSELCDTQLAYLVNSSLRWQFLDASGKLPSGILTGNWNDLGDYYQCLGINQVIDQLEFQGKYCTITIPLNQNPISLPDELPTLPDLPEIPEWPEEWPEIPWPRPDNDSVIIAENYRRLQYYVHQITGLGEPVESRFFPLIMAATVRSMLGICIPKVCTAKQAVDFFQSRVPLVNFTYSEYYCRLPNDKPFVVADYIAIAIFSFIGLLVVCSTSYDLYYRFVAKRSTSSVNSLFVCFSVYTNTRRFLTFNSTPGALECVDGIRAISMIWVVVGHTYCMTMLGFIHNVGDILTWVSKFSSTWINSAPITVDTFFLLSGILVVYTVIGKITKTRFTRSIHLFYLNRFLRMFPLLAALVLLQASLFNHVSDGPYWINPAHAAENCRTYWWAALLHIQNYVNPTEICLAQTWYLSVDMQLYILCPLVLVFMFGREKIAWCTLTAIVLLSLVSSSLYSFLNNFSAALANPTRSAQFIDYVQYYYFNTLARAPPFFVGMIYGYLLYLCKDKKIRISRLNVTILWILSFAMMSFCIFSIYPVLQTDHEAQQFDNFLNAYMRAIWAVGLGWLIFACVHGYGGPINWFLSLQMWKLPARLSYAMYLIHLPIIYTANGSWVKSYYFTDGNNLYRFMSDISLSFVFAFLLCITIDAPCSTLQKLLLGGGARRPQKPVQESQSNAVPQINGTINDRFVKTSL